MFNILKHVLISLLASFILQLSFSNAMEGKLCGDQVSGDVRLSLHPAYLPLFEEPFDSLSSGILTNRHLMIQHSRHVRLTILEIKAFGEYGTSDTDIHTLGASIDHSWRICLKWKHPALPFFKRMKALLTNASSTGIHSQNKVRKIVADFADAMDNENAVGNLFSIDRMELQFLIMPCDGWIDTSRIIALAQALSRKNREEMAIHYLRVLACKLKDLVGSQLLCREAINYCRYLSHKVRPLKEAELWDLHHSFEWNKQILGIEASPLRYNKDSSKAS